MNKKQVFIDTGAWFAIADKSDYFHNKAIEIFKNFIKDGTVLITSNFIINETVMLLTRKISKKTAIQFLDMIYADQNLNIAMIDESIEEKAYKIFKSYKDQDFSITDCSSFVIMKESKIKTAFTFDKHFKTMKFSVTP